MNQNIADQIRQAESEYRCSKEYREDPYRPAYHLIPPVGWLNDPNGLCEFQDEYHVFFQYSPLDAEGGMKAWGHYVSRDFAHWKYLDAPILPDIPEDRDGAYSGSAWVANGKMHIFYTGNVKEEGDYDYILKGRQANTIHLESEDGIHFSEKEIVMTNADYPSYYTCHVRDPKVWKQDGRYYMVQGGRRLGDVGAVIVFESVDMKEWKVVNQILPSEPFGYMWECPDYFEVNGVKLLSFSPQGLESEEYRYQNTYQSGYTILTGDIRSQCMQQEFHEWDMGFDFYAPQTFETKDGRRILIGWAGVPDSPYTNPTVTYGWQHCLTMPREITVCDGKIQCNPVRELEALRDHLVTDEEVKNLKGQYELLMTDIQSDRIRVQLAEGVMLSYDDEVLTLEMNEQAGAGRHVRKMKLEELQELRIFVDVSICEIYVNHGEAVMTSRFYSKSEGPVILEGEQVPYKLWEINGQFLAL